MSHAEMRASVDFGLPRTVIVLNALLGSKFHLPVIVLTLKIGKYYIHAAQFYYTGEQLLTHTHKKKKPKADSVFIGALQRKKSFLSEDYKNEKSLKFP